ncbi:MAG: TIGR04013 family B12-binding domain/radical SAM domain-containing protein [Candidatus Aminicenantes bacterium]|nr:MAG: TIGR04013 family B12-binding domain/radical SAM domain-containing protein [Candidatus Aminicenantes bacterium]
MKKRVKKRVIFRLSPFNRLSFPVLFNVWEKNNIDQAFEIIIRHEPLSRRDIRTGDVILFSFMTSALPQIHAEIKETRKKAVLIAGGGPHITGDQELPFKIGFDTLFVGPGERNFLEFGRDLLDNRPIKNLYQYENSPGSYGDFNDYLPMTKYIKTIGPLEIMRGCFWNCSYCITHLHEAWSRQMDSINTFFRYAKQQNLKRINFISPSSMEYGAAKPGQVNIKKIKELLELAQSYDFPFIEYGIFPSEIRPDTVTDEGMALLKRYVSHKSVTIGAQSSLDSRLKDLNRGHTVEDIRQAAAIANDNGFTANLDFIVGYPGETPEERQTNINFIKTLSKTYRIKTHMHFFIPLPGSAYGYRLPSFLSPEEKDQLHRLTTAGIATDGWINNQKQAQGYLNWLKKHLPGYYSRFS